MSNQELVRRKQYGQIVKEITRSNQYLVVSYVCTIAVRLLTEEYDSRISLQVAGWQKVVAEGGSSVPEVPAEMDNELECLPLAVHAEDLP